jgi:dipeptide/tripeptide permease
VNQFASASAESRPPGFLAQVRSFPGSFWIANTMEIFERMAWYGFFAVSSLYITGPVETGGLGFTSEQRGAIQAIIPFLLYLMPVLTGALADRYGYKKMFIIAYVGMAVFYYALGQFKTMPTFLMAFFCVAVAAAIFKPVVVGTVARLTNESNSRMGFGIFYMMVNVGGFVGPIVAGVVRGWEWKYVFMASSGWALVNLVICLLLYREPTTEADSASRRSLRQVLSNTYEVIGNARFGLTVFVALIALLLASLEYEWFTWTHCAIFVPAWLVLNFLWDGLLAVPVRRGDSGPRPVWLLQRMHCSNWRFATYLLILSGFWTAFNQIFLTMPEYIRDFTETRPLINATKVVFGERAAEYVATINEAERAEIKKKVEALLDARTAGSIPDDALRNAARTLLESKVRLAPAQLRELALAADATADRVTDQVIAAGRQFNPEFIINLNALGIVCFQVLVSFVISRFHQFTAMILGMVVAGVGIGLSALAGDQGMLGPGGLGWIVCAGILIFSFGEMMASPTSQEYVGRIAPEDKKALYMGYYFVAVALGNLFGGILSGQLYGSLARDMQRPDLMWIVFGVLMFLTALIFLIYNRYALPHGSNRTLAPAA